MNVKRLRKLEKHLRKLQLKNEAGNAKHVFNMGLWMQQDIVATKAPKLKVTRNGECKIVAAQAVCHTSACALGEAAMIPEFRRAGLRLVPDAEDGESVSFTPVFRGGSGEEAGAEFFDIETNWANWLFSPSQYRKSSSDIEPIDVARRIQVLIQEHPDTKYSG